MIASKCSSTDLHLALAAVNLKYDDNIEFRRLDAQSGNGQRWRFTLKVISSKAPGHSLGFSRTTKGNRRRIPAACWHVHGDFFAALLEINEAARIYTAGRWVDKDGGNWQDWNAGSMIDPMYASEKCECDGPQEPTRHPLDIMRDQARQQEQRDNNMIQTGTLHEDGSMSNARQVRQGNLTGECWMVQFNGRDYCETCDYKGTPDCGGKHIRLSGKNDKGLDVPV